jgi:hypothetical protein
MHIEALKEILEFGRARLADRLVMIAVAMHLDWRNPHKAAWPSIRRIAEVAGLSERQVKASLARLEAAGELQIVRNAGKRGVNLYWLGPRYVIIPEVLFPSACPWPPVCCAAAERAGVRVKGGVGRECGLCIGPLARAQQTARGDDDGEGVKILQEGVKNKAIPSGEICSPEEGKLQIKTAVEEPPPPTPQHDHDELLSFQQAFYALAYLTGANTSNRLEAIALARVARLVAGKLTHTQLVEAFSGLSLQDVVRELALAVEAEAPGERG